MLIRHNVTILHIALIDRQMAVNFTHLNSDIPVKTRYVYSDSCIKHHLV